MKEQEILEGNKLIAEFMCEATGDAYEIFGADQYHDRWEKLMPVVEEIENLHSGKSYLYSFEMGRDWCGISTNDFTPQTIVAKSVHNNKIMSFWMAIVDFIKWYKQ